MVWLAESELKVQLLVVIVDYWCDKLALCYKYLSFIVVFILMHNYGN
jgi:hypothetical protein